ncbi:SDR family oxidoreductase [Comamonas sp. JC664]|uniref:SDR family NAD(P)-dependent oxidoreductase n=1 Tax=Comamonas sp. JC664 TaxID=2801917 RepID=UPI00174B3181|nr:SDR family oxidoreductase [Comamonas sp. JC664]MBL0697863.1 SDR family oxidoreductase [Comamonas sp. JC664]GHG70024.1 short-chain dehydrogenase [Comamonas sp. KCTC 72670]
MAAFATFQNRVAVLTGGAAGIGLELMLQLVSRGAHVAACDVDRKSLEAAVRRARKLNPDVSVTAHLHDVSEENSVARLVKEVAREHGTDAIHLLFNNAGVVGGGSFVAGPRDEWERTFAVSWFGTYYCTRAFLPMLIAAEQGVIVNTSSVNGLWASLGAGSPHTAYSSAKFAIRGFTESLLVDLRTHAPHVSAVLVMPGHVRTKMPAPPRSWRRALNSLFANYQPLSAKEAAEAILGAVSTGDWRVVIGQDAEAIDARVRAEPQSAYD